MKAFALLMILIPGHPSDMPAVETFDSMAQCMSGLADHVVRIVSADGTAQLVTLKQHGQFIITIYSPHFAAWCEPTGFIDPALRMRIESAPKLP